MAGRPSIAGSRIFLFTHKDVWPPSSGPTRGALLPCACGQSIGNAAFLHVLHTPLAACGAWPSNATRGLKSASAQRVLRAGRRATRDARAHFQLARDSMPCRLPARLDSGSVAAGCARGCAGSGPGGKGIVDSGRCQTSVIDSALAMFKNGNRRRKVNRPRGRGQGLGAGLQRLFFRVNLVDILQRYHAPSRRQGLPWPTLGGDTDNAINIKMLFDQPLSMRPW